MAMIRASRRSISQCCSELPTVTAAFRVKWTLRLEVDEDAAAAEGARLQLLLSRADLDRVAGMLAAADRIRYLTPRLHAEMIPNFAGRAILQPDRASTSAASDSIPRSLVCSTSCGAPT